jgi:hypothetical protein
MMEEWNVGIVKGPDHETNTNASNILTCHCEPEGRGNHVFIEIASSLCSSH